MGLVIAYAVVAAFFLALAAGLYTPKKWRELPEKSIKFLKFGCFFGFFLILVNIVHRFMDRL